MKIREHCSCNNIYFCLANAVDPRPFILFVSGSDSGLKLDVVTKKSPSHHHSTDDTCSVSTPSPSLSGVNRRTSVLFSKKSYHKQPQSTSGGLRKGPGRPPKPRAQLDDGPSDVSPVPSSRKRSASACAGAATMGSPSSSHSQPKRASMGSPSSSHSLPKRGLALSTEAMRGILGGGPDMVNTRGDSFLNYRSEHIRSSSESDSTSDISSSDELLSDSSSGSSSNNSRSGTITEWRLSSVSCALVDASRSLLESFPGHVCSTGTALLYRKVVLKQTIHSSKYHFSLEFLKRLSA